MNNGLKNKLFRIDITICALIAATAVLQMSAATSLLFYISFFVSMTVFLVSLHKNPMDIFQKRTVLCLVCIIIFGFISIASGQINFVYIKKYLIYITALCTFYAAVATKAEEKTIRLLQTEVFVISVLFIYRSFAPGAYIVGRLWLFFSNPNFAGMWIMTLAILNLFNVIIFQKIIAKLLALAVTGYMLYLCYMTNARNIWLSLALFLTFLGYILVRRKPKLSKLVIFCVVSFPLLFAFIYLIKMENGGFSEQLTDMVVSEGKSISSRYAIWMEALEYFKLRPIFGAYSIAQGGSGAFQLHNTHIDILAAYGLVGIILFLRYTYGIYVIAVRNSTEQTLMIMAGFAATVFFMGSGEASLFSSGMGLYIFCAAFLLLRDYNFSSDYRG